MPEVEQVSGVERAQAEAVEEKAPQRKKSIGPKLIIFLVAQLILAVAGYMIVVKFLAPDPAFQKAKEKPAQTQAEADKKAKKTIYTIEDVVVNPAGTGGSRYLSVSVGVEMEGEPAGGGHGGKSNPLEEQMPRLRDALITILSSRTIEQLTNAEEKELMRREIQQTFASLLHPKTVYQIYFIDFVLQ